MASEFFHAPVLLNEVIEYLVTGAGIYVDGTLGGGGHSEKISFTLAEKEQALAEKEQALLEQAQRENKRSLREPQSLVIGIDQDQVALAAATKRLSALNATPFRAIEGNFGNLTQCVKAALQTDTAPKLKGVLLDLGVSSHQLDEASRGFSFQKAAALDMRMSQRSALTAKDIVNEYDEAKLAKIFFEYGEEKRSRTIAKRLVEARQIKPIETTDKLADVVKRATPRVEQTKTLARIFQAIRIEVNQELDALKRCLTEAHDLLESGGRLVVISYHSLEDRIVKDFLRQMSADDWGAKGVPIQVPLRKATMKMLTKKPVEPSDEEIERNSRARSAKLRAAEKI